MFGTLCVGLFATPDRIARSGNTEQKAGLFYGGGTEQLIDQLIGVLACGAYVIVVSAIAWTVIKVVMGIRVSAEEEPKVWTSANTATRPTTAFSSSTNSSSGRYQRNLVSARPEGHLTWAGRLCRPAQVGVYLAAP